VLQNTALKPTGVRVIVRPNAYEKGRGHIIVYNWDRLPTVSADVSSVLPVGAVYEVRDAQNYFGGPVAQGTYDGTPISVPMNLTQVAAPIGNVERRPPHTAPEFGTFVLRQIASP